MECFEIVGPCKLNGEIIIGGAKNSSLPIMAATLLAAGKSVLKSVPNLSDISVCSQFAKGRPCRYYRGSKKVKISTGNSFGFTRFCYAGSSGIGGRGNHDSQ